VREQIIQYIGTTPLLVGDPDFPAQLGDAVRLLADRLLTLRQGGSRSDVSDRLDALSAQQTAVLDALRRLDAALAGEGDRRSRTPRDDDAGLPAAVAARFTAARDALDTLFEPPAALGEMFAVDVDGSGLPAARQHPGRFTFDRRQMTSLGLLAAVDRLLRAFRDGVSDWWRAVDRSAQSLSPQWLESLSDLCRSFDISMEVLPVLEPASPTAGTALALRRDEARELLGGLAESVENSLIAAARGVPVRREPPASA
jgi:hypothetical protein